MPEKVHSIQAVSRQTGLSAHVIRAWEKRYQAVTPMRTETNRRRYSDAEVKRLRLLRSATQAGHSICCIAQLSEERLLSLATSKPMAAETSAGRPEINGDPEKILTEAIDAIKRLDGRGLEDFLINATVSLGHQGMLNRVVVPLTEKLGSLWREGVLKICHEHLASAVLRTVLGDATKHFLPHPSAPVLVVGTPAGQVHELGAAIASALAAQQGWKVTYLGTNLPAHEIASAALQCSADAIGLSLVYPMGDPRVDAELVELRRLVGNDLAIIAGGRAAPSHSETLKRINATLVQCLVGFADHLDHLHATRGNGAPAEATLSNPRRAPKPQARVD